MRCLVLCLTAVLATPFAVARDVGKTRPTEAQARAASRRAVVYADSTVPIPVLARRLPPRMRIVTEYAELLVVESTEELSPAALETLRKIPGVAAVERDSVVEARPKALHAGGDRTDGVAGGKGGAPKKGCVLTDLCANGTARYWAKQAVDADLMRARVRELVAGVKSEAPVPVAVLDSGMDKAQVAQMVSVGGVKTKQGVVVGDVHPYSKEEVKKWRDTDVIGNPESDESGHGTMVSSVIAGKDTGIAENVALTSYRVTGPGDTGSTFSSYLQLSALKACLENRDKNGLTIINLSWGGRSDEAGFKREEDDAVQKKLIARFAEEGCLVVKAAGNDSFQRDHASDLDDAYLRVAAIDGTYANADFSSKGEVAAPGASVAVLESTTAKRKAGENRRCHPDDKDGPSPTRMVDGTSFAAPLTAALASQVVRVLKVGPAFAALRPSERIKLVNRILKASTFNGTVNGLRAVEIAHRWNQNAAGLGDGPLAKGGVAVLTKLMTTHPAPICGAAKEPCEKIADCGKLQACFDRGRARVAVCPGIDVATVSDLARTALAHGAQELGIAFLHVARDGRDGAVAGALTTMALDRWLDRIGYKRGAKTNLDKLLNNQMLAHMDVNFLRVITVPFLRDCKKSDACDSQLVEDLVEAVLRSHSVGDYLARGLDPKTGEDRGSNAALAAVAEAVSLGRAMFGDFRVKRMLAEHATEQLNEHADSGPLLGPGYVVPVARMLDALIVAEKQPGFKKELLALEKSTLDGLRKKNDHFAESTARQVSYWEHYPTRSVFDGMLMRNRKAIDDAVESGDLSALAPVQLHFLLRKMSEIPEWRKKETELFIRIIEHVTAGKGWGVASDIGFFESALVGLDQARAKLPKAGMDALAKRFREALSGASNLHLVSALLYERKANTPVGMAAIDFLSRDWDELKERRKTGPTYATHPWLVDEELANDLGRRLVASVLNASPKTFGTLVRDYQFRHGLIAAMQGLGAVTDKTVKKAHAPFSAVPPLSRLSTEKERKLSAVPWNGDAASSVDTFERMLAAYLAGDAKSRNWGSIVDWLLDFSIYRFKESPQGTRYWGNLAGRPGWQKTAREILAAAEKNPDAFPEKEVLKALRTALWNVEWVRYRVALAGPASPEKLEAALTVLRRQLKGEQWQYITTVRELQKGALEALAEAAKADPAVRDKLKAEFHEILNGASDVGAIARLLYGARGTGHPFLGPDAYVGSYRRLVVHLLKADEKEKEKMLDEHEVRYSLRDAIEVLALSKDAKTPYTVTLPTTWKTEWLERPEPERVGPVAPARKVAAKGDVDTLDSVVTLLLESYRNPATRKAAVFYGWSFQYAAIPKEDRERYRAAFAASPRWRAVAEAIVADHAAAPGGHDEQYVRWLREFLAETRPVRRE